MARGIDDRRGPRQPSQVRALDVAITAAMVAVLAALFLLWKWAGG